MKLHLTWPVSIATVALVLAGCSTSEAGNAAESSASGSPSTPATAASSPELQKAADDYKAYAVAQSDELVKVVKVFTDAIRAGNLKAAQDAYAPSRMPWERIEPIAELVEDTDAKTDSRVDDFAGVDDPKFTGWHRLEYLLFDKNTLEGAVPFADQLDADIDNLQKELLNVKVEPINVANGAAELIEEVSQGKLTGEEDRQDRPVGLRRKPAGFAGRRRQPERAAERRRRRAAGQDHRRVLAAVRHHAAAAPGRWLGEFLHGEQRVSVAAVPIGDGAAAGRRRAEGAARGAV